MATAALPRLLLNRPDRDLPQHVWHVHELANTGAVVLPSGHPLLDAQLPGGGWPVGGMVEVLQPQPELHVWRLLLPALGQLAQQQPGPVVLVNAPCPPFVPSLSAQGLAGERLLWIRADRAAACLWAAEQALRCAEVAAVLAWLPQARSTELRRLHLASQQNDRLLFVFRAERAQHEASPAALRLRVDGTGTLNVRILKRRGPPLEETLALSPHPPELAALLAARQASGDSGLPPPRSPPALEPARIALPGLASALDRIAAAA